MSNNDYDELYSHVPEWKCHKIIRGFKIGSIVGNRVYAEGNDSLFVDLPSDKMYIINAYASLGNEGYLAIYENGYLSVSPVDQWENGYSPISKDGLYPLDREVKVFWYDTVEEVVEAHWKPVAEAEGIPYEEFIQGTFGGETDEGVTHEYDYQTFVESCRTQGCWGFSANADGMNHSTGINHVVAEDHPDHAIHVWAAPGCDPTLLLDMIAHELAHAHGPNDPDDLREELRAYQIGVIAGKAMDIITDRYRVISSTKEQVYYDDNGTNVYFDDETEQYAIIDINGLLVTLNFQQGYHKQVGVNGFTNEMLLAVLAHRIERLNAEVPSEENESCVRDIRSALSHLERRIANRKEAGIYGTDAIA